MIKKGGLFMAYSYSQIRWPDDLHNRAKEVAYNRRVSLNKLIVDVMSAFIEATGGTEGMDDEKTAES